MEKSLKELVVNNGLNYADYLRQMQKEATDEYPASEAEQNHLEYTKLNLKRTERIEKTYTVSDNLKKMVKAIDHKQIWMVLTEPWCGDSAQNLPCIAKIAAENSNIELKILLRDDHPDVMDRYLTDGKRAIPKLIALGENGEEIFHWGPRPKVAAELFNQMKNENVPIKVIHEKIHLWYGRNRGKDLEEEFIKLLGL